MLPTKFITMAASEPQFPCQYHGERASQVALLVKNLPASAGHIRDVGSIPGSGRSPGGGNGNPLQCSFLGNPMDKGVLRITVNEVTKEGYMT